MLLRQDAAQRKALSSQSLLLPILQPPYALLRRRLRFSSIFFVFTLVHPLLHSAPSPPLTVLTASSDAHPPPSRIHPPQAGRLLGRLLATTTSSPHLSMRALTRHSRTLHPTENPLRCELHGTPCVPLTSSRSALTPLSVCIDWRRLQRQTWS